MAVSVSGGPTGAAERASARQSPDCQLWSVARLPALVSRHTASSQSAAGQSPHCKLSVSPNSQGRSGQDNGHWAGVQTVAADRLISDTRSDGKRVK